MKVKDLILELQKYNGDLEVKIEDIFEGYYNDSDITGIKKAYDSEEYEEINYIIIY